MLAYWVRHSVVVFLCLYVAHVTSTVVKGLVVVSLPCLALYGVVRWVMRSGRSTRGWCMRSRDDACRRTPTPRPVVDPTAATTTSPLTLSAASVLTMLDRENRWSWRHDATSPTPGPGPRPTRRPSCPDLARAARAPSTDTAIEAFYMDGGGGGVRSCTVSPVKRAPFTRMDSGFEEMRPRVGGADAGDAGLQRYAAQAPVPPPADACGQRLGVIQELLDTEKTYVAHLKTVHELYVAPMEKMAKQTGGFRYYTNPAPLTMDEVRFIFSGFPNIYQLHMHVILPMLEKTVKSDTFGAAFIQISAYLPLYATYIQKVQDGMARWVRLLNERKSTRSFAKRAKQHPRHTQIHLQSYLLMPIQRIPRYVLLLETLLQHTPQTHADYQDLVGAFWLIRQCANKINATKAWQENGAKMADLQDRFSAHRKDTDGHAVVLRSYRHFIKEGVLHLMSFQDHRPSDMRHNETYLAEDGTFLLFNDALMCCSEKRGGKLLKRFEWTLKRSAPAYIKSEHLLMVDDEDHSFIFSGPAQDLKEWLHAFNHRDEYT